MAQHIDINLDELRQLRHRIDSHQLKPKDYPVVGALVSKVITRTESRQSRMLAKLANDAAKKADTPDSSSDAGASLQNNDLNGSDTAPCDKNTTSNTHTAQSSGPTSQNDTNSAQNPELKKKPKGHGRNGADAFVNAQHFTHTLTPDVIGSLCEKCKAGSESNRGIGRMSNYREKVIVRVIGQPLFAAEMHHYEQVRCRFCGDIIRATGPANVLEGIGTDYIRYDWSACAMLIFIHYYGAGPFKRLETFHQGWGVPLSDANQWKIVDESDDLLASLYKAMENYGIQNAINFIIDDTGSMVLSIKKQIQDEISALERLGQSTKDVRTGINTTGVYLETQDAKIVLYYTGRHHAGEIIDQMFKRRQSSKPKVIKVTDAASKNFSHDQEDKLIEATCNAHALLKFRDIKDKYPTEYAFVGEIYNKIFDNDDEAKARGLTPDERMHYHQKHSKPLMEKLKAMCENKIKNKLVEPNSLLWEPLSYILNQWPRLTQFYKVPGVPLDSNLVEQALIMPVRYLAGSFNYKNETGAEVGDRNMSLIATARANEVEPVAYLTECLRNHQDLAKRPDYYLPWVYRERMKEQDKSLNSELGIDTS